MWPSFLITLVTLLCTTALLVSANVDKIIFLGPSQIQNQDLALPSATLGHLDSISPQKPRFRHRLRAHFPDSHSVFQEPSEAWLLLDGLHPGQRYEVRVCWAATQPTKFNLLVYEPAQLLDTPKHIASIAGYVKDYAKSKQTDSNKLEEQVVDKASERLASRVFLHLTASADYFTSNRTLMTDGLLVDVDIILDPYLFNILPASLVPTAIYIFILSLLSWFLSSWIWNCIDAVVQSTPLTATPTRKLLKTT